MAQPAPATDPNAPTVTIDKKGIVTVSPDPLVLTNGQPATVTFTAYYPTNTYDCDLKIKFKGWKAKAAGGKVGNGGTITIGS